MASEVLALNAPIFEKRTAAELTENEMLEIDGGTANLCIFALYVGIAGGLATAYTAGVAVGQWLYSATH